MAPINDPPCAAGLWLPTSPLKRAWFLFLLLVGLVGGTGCSGCFESPQTLEEREKQLAKKETKDDFDPPQLSVLPRDDRSLSGEDGPIRLNRVKPGHWTSVSTQLKANNFDFRGELYAYTIGSENLVVPITDTDYYLSTTRPVALPKGQSRWADILYFPPLFEGNITRTRLFACDLRPAGGGRPVLIDRLATTRMHPQEYYLVVLASSADDYQFLEATDVVRPLHGLVSAEESAPHYRLVLPKVLDRAAVPENSMAWTSIAYVIWDGIDPEILSLDQQQAMVDWLHFGGQLIVSGPDSLNQLKLSFLADYLPAEDAGSIELNQSDFETWNEEFVTTERIYESNRWTEKAYTVDLRAGSLRGSQLKLHPEATFIPKTGDLVAERRVGRGRIAATAFQIRAPDISRNWKNFDTFLNAILLRRPARQFKADSGGEVITSWAKPFGFNDPRLVTSLRFMSRDLVNYLPSYQQRGSSTSQPQQEDPRVTETLRYAANSRPANPIHSEAGRNAVVNAEIDSFGGFTFDRQSGVAGWSDQSGVAEAARLCLREAAGITIPSGNFVLRVTAGYLLVLVPLNWFVFWMLGRVEWAWIAAPVIAIVGALCVIKLAELDIGFARSRTEVAFLETHAGYHRAHLTRYTSLYTSLSTHYDLDFSESTAVSLPFGRGADRPSNQTRRLGSGPSEVRYHQEGSDIQLTGLQVASNSSTMIHSEYFFSPSIEPIFRWIPNESGESTLTYSGPHTLRDVGIVRRNLYDSDVIEVAWVGDLEGGSERNIRFAPAQDNWELLAQWNTSPVLGSEGVSGEVSLRHLLNVVKDIRQLQPGEARLIGWTDEDLPGMTVTPAANQRTIRTMIVGHLQHAPLPPPQPDVNTRRFQGQEPEQIQAMQLEAIEGL